ncbi:MAG: hypothetical protein IKL89_05195 [Clostridia bacterium]|nr:hypothetical protein [Clostridia bacterium]
MRKTYRQFATVFALLMLALFLVGCDALDAMREEHGVYAGETDRSTVTFRGETYRELGLDAEKLFYRDLSSRVYITEPDVPVLLASTVGEYGQTDAEMNFIVLYRERNAVYAREDIYEEALAETKMEDPYTCIRLQYLDGKNSGRGWQYHTLSEAEEALVRRVLAGVPLKEEAVDFAYLSPSQTLFFESETGLFADNSYEIVEFSGGVAIRDCNFYDKGDPEYYIAGEADALLLKELLDKYPG